MAFQLCGRGWPESSAKHEMSATLRDRSPPREVDKAFWVDAVVLGEGAEAVQAKQPALDICS